MKITIEYCNVWNYRDRAASLAAKLQNKFSTACELIESSGGAFEVVVDGKCIYSKKRTGEFPDDEQLLNTIAGNQAWQKHTNKEQPASKRLA